MFQRVKTAYRSFFKGQMYYFCAKSCQQRFEESPARYVSV
ncbi:YHS domain-containing protein [Candidatus Pyrohabitans sp.]